MQHQQKKVSSNEHFFIFSNDFSAKKLKNIFYPFLVCLFTFVETFPSPLFNSIKFDVLRFSRFSNEEDFFFVLMAFAAKLIFLSSQPGTSTPNGGVCVVINTLMSYRVCHQFRLTQQDDYFWVNFDFFWSKLCFFRQLGQ